LATRELVVDDRHTVGHGTVSHPEHAIATALAAKDVDG
jgi:hypothetical protein